MSHHHKIVIWGAGGHAVVVANIVELQGMFEVIGFLDDVNPERKGQIFCGKPILGGQEQLAKLSGIEVNHIALGIGNCAARLSIGDITGKSGYSLPSLVHPSAVVASNITIGAGTIIIAGVVLDPTCHIGSLCIVNNNATISHHCVIGDGVHIGPGVNLAGNVKVGRGSWIGIGTNVVENIQIGNGSYVGAGSVVVKNIPDGVLAYGNPARVIKPIKILF